MVTDPKAARDLIKMLCDVGLGSTALDYDAEAAVVTLADDLEAGRLVVGVGTDFFTCGCKPMFHDDDDIFIGIAWCEAHGKVNA